MRATRIPATANLLVSDVMTPDPVCVERGTPLRQVASLLEDLEISGAPVVDEAKTVIGVVSKTDILRCCLDGVADGLSDDLFDALSDEAGEEIGVEREPQVLVEEIMSADVVTARPDEQLKAVARRMAEARVHRAVVVDPSNYPLGIVTSLDLLHALARA